MTAFGNTFPLVICGIVYYALRAILIRVETERDQRK
jgi:hypothetical protein